MIKRILPVLTAMLMLPLLWSCSEDNPEPPVPQGPMDRVERTVLMYAVASNSLSYNLDLDMKEIQQVAASLDLKKSRLLVYSVQLDPKTGETMQPKLQRLVKMSYGYDFQTIKEYDSLNRSTDTERIAAVIADVKYLSPSDKDGLILWSHSDAWLPSPTWTASNTMQYAFGQDKDGKVSHYCEMPDLAATIPAGMFDFIWFDSCYMANVETLYQFRGKADYLVGSVTELSEYGMPYDVTLPELLKKDVNLVQTAALEYNTYITQTNSPFTISVLDLSKVENLADITAHCYSDFKYLDGTTGLQCYSRRVNPALYDFGQYTREIIRQNHPDTSEQLLTEFQKALDEVVVYKACTDKSFTGYPINRVNYSGLSCHRLSNDMTLKGAVFYRTLDWYNRVYGDQKP